MQFSEVLATLPSIDHIAALELSDGGVCRQTGKQARHGR
jgi:hypothetical protein